MLQNKCVKYFSDGSSAQCKILINFIYLIYHVEDHGSELTAFFVIWYGKGVCDGVSDTIKHKAMIATFQWLYEDQILNASDLDTFTKDSINKIKTWIVKKSEMMISN